MKQLFLHSGEIVLVSDIDHIPLVAYAWQITKRGYVYRRPKQELCIYLHVEILQRIGYKDFERCDHKDMNTLNCQRENLRPATQSTNAKNSKLRSDNTSGHHNVCWSNNINKWIAYINVNGRHIHIGSYDRKEQAIYDARLMSKFYFGDFARFDNQEGE